MRLATWNVNSVGARLPRLVDWLATSAPDVLCLQETKCAADAFPADAVREVGYDVDAHGDGRWNGVAIVSRVGLEVVTHEIPGVPAFPADAPAPEARAMAATCGGVRVWSVYVPNGREVDSDHYAYKLEWLAALKQTISAELASYPRLVVMGDFNVAPTDADVWDPAVFVGSTHVTKPERAAYRDLLALGLSDLEARPLKGDHPYTYWDYRQGAFHKGMGMRIDLVLASAELAGSVTDAYVDRNARKGTGPSDHAPVVVDADIDAGRAASAG
jgi:exodeoxyribonuclease-3